MSGPKFTVGLGSPWTVEKVKVRGGAGEHWERVIIAADGERVAVVEDCGGGTPKRANIICASPEMYAACHALIYGDDLQVAIDLARAALARARGEA